MKENMLMKFSNSDNLCAMIDGKIITRKSLYDARVYSEPYNSDEPFVYYKSRLQHCGSCLTDAEYGYGLDECCCIHAQFHSKHEENQYVKSTGFWKLPLPAVR